jgi:hypothetical protein
MTKGPSNESTPADPQIDHSAGAAELRGEVYRPPEYLDYLADAAAAMKAIRLIVYASLASFIILALYGFVLIYKLTSDVHLMVGQAGVMTQQMQAMARSMANLNGSIGGMAYDLSQMKGDVAGLDGSVTRMSDAVTLMQHSASNIDQSMGPVMGSINRFFPFGYSGYPGSPPYAR